MPRLGAGPKVHLNAAGAKHPLHCRRDRSHGEPSRGAKQESNSGAVDEVHLAQIKNDFPSGQPIQLGFECLHGREVYLASHLDEPVPLLGTSFNVQLSRRHEHSHPSLPFDVRCCSPRSERPAPLPRVGAGLLVEVGLHVDAPRFGRVRQGAIVELVLVRIAL